VQNQENDNSGLIHGKKFKLVQDKAKLRTTFNPLVSIVLPTYNRASLLYRAIESVLNQTYFNFELIVVDDCSKDSTKNVVKGFSDNRIRYIRHEKNKGAPAARNSGIAAARGEYIAFQDSDDEWFSTKLEKQMSLFDCAPRDLGVVYTSFWVIDQGKKTLIPPLDLKKTDGEIHDMLLETNFISTPTAVVRKECFKKVGMFANIPRLQDWELWLRISKYFFFKHLKEPLVYAYTQADSITRDTDALILARKYILFKYFYAISKRPKLLSKHYFDIGTTLCSKGKIKEGRNYFFKALSANPLNAKLLLRAISSIFGLTAYKKYVEFYCILQNITMQHRNT
jgi:glycosyltransferase involved in cell wall biosynthesis